MLAQWKFHLTKGCKKDLFKWIWDLGAFGKFKTSCMKVFYVLFGCVFFKIFFWWNYPLKVGKPFVDVENSPNLPLAWGWANTDCFFNVLLTLVGQNGWNSYTSVFTSIILFWGFLIIRCFSNKTPCPVLVEIYYLNTTHINTFENTAIIWEKEWIRGI